MNAQELRKLTLDKIAGCHFDSARGIYIGEAVQEFAVSLGWTEHLAEPKDSEHYHEATQDAEDWLNEEFPYDGYYWGGNENGDWGLWKVDADQLWDHGEFQR